VYVLQKKKKKGLEQKKMPIFPFSSAHHKETETQPFKKKLLISSKFLKTERNDISIYDELRSLIKHEKEPFLIVIRL